MICKNCANIFSDDLTVCPDCGTPIKGSTENKIKKETEIENIISLSLEEVADKTKADKTEFAPAPYPADEKKAEVKKTAPPAKKTVSAAVKKPQQITTVKPTEKITKKEKNALTFIFSIMCAVFVCMGVLSVISITTDTFEQDENAVMAIALSGLSDEETAELEDILSKTASVAYAGFDRKKEVIVDVMDYLTPNSKGGLYSRFFGDAELTANEPDPNGRFKNENGDYSFYALPAEKVESILARFGFEPNHNVNEKEFYYYKGNYYFSNIQSKNISSTLVADISSSKRIQDGSYYVECSFFDPDAQGKNNKYLEAFIILSRNTDEKTDENHWSISRISHNALFDANGFMIEDNSGKNDLYFEMRTEVIEVNTTKKHKPYEKYVIEYPYFTGNTPGEKAVNQLFSDLVANYRKKADELNVNKAFNRYLKNGGEQSSLPFVTHVVSRVTYNRNGYISIVEGISSDKVILRAPAEETTTSPSYSSQSQSSSFEPVTLPERSIEGYIFDVATGQFLSKKEIIDADYQLVEEIIYRIYEGYEYASLVKDDEDDSSYDSVPSDTDGIGKTFYEGASAMGDNGFVFGFVHPKGYTETVVIPYNLENFFNADFSKNTAENEEETEKKEKNYN